METPTEMVLVAAGDFTMGSISGEGGDNERPQHRVYVSAFYIDRYEVTNAQFQRFIEAGGYRKQGYWSDEGWVWLGRVNATGPRYWGGGRENCGPRYPRYPVMGVSWYEAEAYARWAGKRLPTEAEWEKAARGTDGRKYPWGNEEPTCERANFGGSWGCGWQTKPVGSCAAGRSPYGVEDLAGNVREWVADWYGENYYDSSSASDPRGPMTGSDRVLRGGAWGDGADSLRSAYRYGSPSHRVSPSIGFRCARTLP
jgi:formylglycine-generating enzyme required for sulfatase activity